MEGKWLSILEYAAYRNKSISTVRRYIKNERVKYRNENGKYYIWAPNYFKKEKVDERQQLSSQLEIQELQGHIRRLQEENEELRMLVDLYEKQLNPLPKLPDLPELN